MGHNFGLAWKPEAGSDSDTESRLRLNIKEEPSTGKRRSEKTLEKDQERRVNIREKTITRRSRGES